MLIAQPLVSCCSARSNEGWGKRAVLDTEDDPGSDVGAPASPPTPKRHNPPKHEGENGHGQTVDQITR
jgi:hypothetical protein